MLLPNIISSETSVSFSFNSFNPASNKYSPVLSKLAKSIVLLALVYLIP